MHVIATAGHVDHGKSTLIRRLTGIDPDRLAEEKQRGLTIDLGFAWMRTPGGREIGIVDVPGHERFVANMLSGVGPVGEILFVVDATEGWRAQSEEHLAIVDLLGARAAVVALTKSDLVGAETLDVAAEVRARLAGTAIADAEIVAVSAVSGDGIDALLAAVDAMLDRAGEPPADGRARVFVDRVFSIKGAGTVVTGTLTGGRLRVGDEIVVGANVRSARIRGIQTHKRSVDEAEPVARVALNLVGVDRDQIERGDAVVRPREWIPTAHLDVELRGVRTLDHVVSAKGSFKCHVGSAERDARLRLYTAPGLEAGATAFARITLSEPVYAAAFDRVVLRDTGRRATVAGGMVLDAHPPMMRSASRAARVPALEARATAARDDLPTLALAEAGAMTAEALFVTTGSRAEPREGIRCETLWLSKARFDDVVARIEGALAEFHAAEPLAAGMPRSRLEATVEPTLLREVLARLDGRVVADGATVRLATHRVRLDPSQEAARAAILRSLDGDGIAGAAFEDLSRGHGERLVRTLVDAGDLVRVGASLVFSAEQIARAKAAIAEAFARDGALTASKIKEILGTSRKHAIPLLEHLDAIGFTRRQGDLREVR